MGERWWDRIFLRHLTNAWCRHDFIYIDSWDKRKLKIPHELDPFGDQSDEIGRVEHKWSVF
jgi:hypothetical protein